MKSSAAVVVALVVLAGVVTGRERSPTDPPAAARAVFAPELDLSRLSRERREGVIEDVFAVPQSPAAPLAAPRVEPVAAPAAPPLPFSYLGRMKKGERITLYLLKSQEMLIVHEGETFDGIYRLERITDAAAHFLYLPLGTAQTLAIPPAP